MARFRYVELEDMETTGCLSRSDPDICGVVVDRQSAAGYVMIYDNRHRPIQKVGNAMTGQPYIELMVGSGQTCVIHGDSTVLYYDTSSGHDGMRPRVTLCCKKFRHLARASIKALPNKFWPQLFL
jgi:hypothetical protein